MEIREAITLNKPLVLMHETDARHDPFDFVEAYETAPKDLSALLDAHESLPFRRRGYVSGV